MGNPIKKNPERVRAHYSKEFYIEVNDDGF